MTVAALNRASLWTPTRVVRCAMLAFGVVMAMSIVPVPAADDRSPLMSRLDTLPLTFEANSGQFDRSIQFLARGRDHAFFFRATDAVLVGRSPSAQSPPAMVRLAFAGSNPESTVEGVDIERGKSHYFIGNDPARWRADVPRYRQIRYLNLYEGVDAVFYGNAERLEYDFVVAPHADPRQIELQFTGARDVRLDRRGNLIVDLGDTEWIQHQPVVYQEREGSRQAIDGRYVLAASDRVRVEVGPYDPTQPLVIDPIVSFATYLGGGHDDGALAVAVDGTGDIYIAGTTASLDFPVTPGAFDRLGDYDDIFVSKFSHDGSRLIYSTFLGGFDFDTVADIRVDRDGNVFVAGTTLGSNFPTTPGAYQERSSGQSDAFVTKLNAGGSALIYSTLLGGREADSGNALAIDAAGTAYIAGATVSATFPTTTGVLQPLLAGGADGFITALNASGSALVYSTFLGGTRRDAIVDVAIHDSGVAYIAGETASTNFPVTPDAHQSSHAGGVDLFAATVSGNGAALIYGTYLGGAATDTAPQIVLDSNRNLYVAGTTRSSNYPTTAGALQRTLRGPQDIVVTRFDATPRLSFSTYLGGSAEDSLGGLAVDGTGGARVAGWTYSADFPLVAPTQPHHAGIADAVIAHVNPSGSAVTFATYLGGSSFDYANAIAIDANDATVLVGATFSGDFPTTPGAFQRDEANWSGGAFDAFLVKVATGAGNHNPPHNLTIRAIADNTVTFEWSPPLGSAQPTAYVLEGGLSPGTTLGTLQVDGTRTAVSVTLPTGLFYVRARALYAATISGPSTEVATHVNVLARPSAPVGLLAFESDFTVGLRWTNTSMGGAPTHLRLTVVGEGVNSSTILPPSDAFSVRLPPQQGVYRIFLRAANAVGESDPAIVEVFVPGSCYRIPARPVDLRLDRAGTLVTASWNLARTGPAPDSFVVAVSGTLTGTFRVAGRSISGTVGPGIYTVRVAAQNPCGTSGFTTPQTITVP